MYFFESRIRYSELDETGCLKLEGLLDYFQDCSTFHSEDIGLGVDYLKERSRVWVMSSWHIVVNRYPKLGERVMIGTAPYDFKGFMGYRNFLMKDRLDNCLACANTVWSLLDTRTGKPARATEEMLKGYVLEPKLPMDYAPRRISLPEHLIKGEPVAIRPFHLDTNHHVNNGQFVRIAMESLGGSRKVAQLRAEYKKQIMLGDVLVPYTSCEGGREVAVLKDEQGAVCCIVELLGKNGQKQNETGKICVCS